jgi:hypothetical protein
MLISGRYPTEVSHVLFTARPQDPPVRAVARVEVPTRHPNGTLALAVAKLDAVIFQPDPTIYILNYEHPAG